MALCTKHNTSVWSQELMFTFGRNVSVVFYSQMQSVLCSSFLFYHWLKSVEVFFFEPIAYQPA